MVGNFEERPRLPNLRRGNSGTILALLAVICVLLAAVFVWWTYYGPGPESSIDYFLQLQSNGSATHTIMVPVSQTERLNQKIKVVSGNAQIGLTAGEHGQGLVVNFSGKVTIRASLSNPSWVEDQLRFTMENSSRRNDTANSTEYSYWFYHSNASTGTAVKIWIMLSNSHIDVGEGRGYDGWFNEGWQVRWIH